MMGAIIFLGITLLLTLEGTLAARIITKDRSIALLLSLSLPLSSLANVLFVGLFTVTSIALTPISIIGAHTLLTIVLFLFARRVLVLPPPARNVFWHSNAANIVSGLILASIAIYSFSHAVLLPSFQYDSATNWTMRSQISFYDQRMAFDETEVRGMAKPQYPYLFHAFQITANQGQKTWSDTAANVILYLFGLGTVFAIFLLFSRIRGTSQSLLTIAAIFGTPLLGMHMAQGYGDSVLIELILLGFTATLLWIDQKKKEWLLLSGILFAACVWTKAEGLVFGLLPWLLTIGLIAWKDKTFKVIRVPVLTSIIVGCTWTVSALIAGLSLTPHSSSDATFAPSVAAMKEAFIALFDRGSFGIHWYAVLVMLVLIGFLIRTKHALIDRVFIRTLLMGGLTFVIVLAIYTLTPNSRFLLNAESYYRQMLIPLGLLILSISACVKHKQSL